MKTGVERSKLRCPSTGYCWRDGRRKCHYGVNVAVFCHTQCELLNCLDTYKKYQQRILLVKAEVTVRSQTDTERSFGGFAMKVRRHFNLDRIGHRYESIEFEVEASTIEQAMQQIEEAWKRYNKAIVDGVVQ